MKSGALTVAILLMISCSQQREMIRGEGFIEVNGGKIWYNVTGAGNKTPILLLHGGPGYPSYYLNPLTRLGVDRPVIMFDQLGCGRSDRIGDTTLMTIDNYVEQVKELVNFLKIDEFYLYGHSWGTMLGTDYYLRYPEGIKGLILASPCLDAKRWVKDAEGLIATLPDSTATVLRNSIAGIPQDAAILKSAVVSYLERFYIRKKPLPADIDSADVQMGTNIYVYMWGENEFFATGSLRDYDRTGDLGKIKVPVLYTTGEFDEAQPATVKYYDSLTPDSSFEIISNAGHMTMHDNPDEDLKAISGFLNKTDLNGANTRE